MPTTSASTPERILLAYDDVDLQAYVRRFLSSHWVVEAAKDGVQALAAARERPPDLIIADVALRGLGGVELLRELRADPRTATLPVILLASAHGEGMNAGADDYVIKPFGARELVARVRARLEIARLRRETEQRITNILESITDGFQVFDGEGRLTYMNPAARRFLAACGMDAEALIGRIFWAEDYPQSWSREARQQLRKAMEERVPAAFESYYPPGRRWYENRVYPLADGGLANYFRDVTERRRIESRDAFLVGLDDATRPLTDPVAITETAARLLCEQLAADRVVYAEVEDDQDACRAIGEYAGGGPSLLGRYRLSGFGRILRERLLAGEPVVCDDIEDEPQTEGSRQAFRAVGIRAHIAVPLAKEGSLVAVMAVHQATPRSWRRDELELVARVSNRCWESIERARAEEALRDADRRKNEFLATLAHELRNPLAPIRNSLYFLRRLDGANPETDQIHAMMERQVSHMVRLVDELMEVSRITRGKIELQRERVELAAVLESAIETSRPLIEGAHHRLEISLPPGPLPLEADPVRLAQVFSNLLNNAAKYTDPGGRIWLGVRDEGTRVGVSVRDTGSGIPANMLPHVFDMFMQGKSHAGRSQGGLGIGLTLVRSLVQMHGGSVEAKSAGPGQGSEFVVHLPLAPREPCHEAVPAEHPAGAPASVHSVLIVDDNHDAADSLGRLLQNIGAEVRVVYDGPSALAELDTYHPAAVVLDLGMPGMDGYEVARRIRRHPEAHDVTLIALTGWGQEKDRRRSRRAGFDHHLIKPADLDALKAALAF